MPRPAAPVRWAAPLLLAALLLAPLGLGAPAPPAGAAPAAPAAPLDLVLNAGQASGEGASIMAVDTSTGAVVGSVLQGDEVDDVTVTPDATTAYVTVVNFGPDHVNGLVPVDLTTRPPRAEPVVDLGSTCEFPTTVTVVPDGSEALVACNQGVLVVGLTGGPSVGPLLTAPGLDETSAIAINPDGRTAYAVFGPAGAQSAGRGRRAAPADTPDSGVVPIDLTAVPPRAGAAVAVGQLAVDMVVAPDGRTGWVSDIAGSALYPLDLTTDPLTVGPPVTDNLVHPLGLALTPDGRTVFAVDNETDGEVTPVDVSQNPPVAGTPVAVGNAPLRVAVTPDGAQAIVTNQIDPDDPTHGSLSFVDTATDTVSRTVAAGPSTNQEAVQPDQAPRAALAVTAAPPGQATTLSAAASTVAFGTIASYAWSFGDGTSAVTATPVTSHVYADAERAYPASVTETDSAGTSTTPVWTGPIMLRHGGPQARALATVVFPPCRPCATTALAASPLGSGFLLAQPGGVAVSFGDAYGTGMLPPPVSKPVCAPAAGCGPPPTAVGAALTSTNGGYWEVWSNGAVTTAGAAGNFGDLAGGHLNAPLVGLAPAPGDQGYWLASADGGVYAFGSARFFGSMGGRPLNAPIVGLAATPDGRGYWLVAADGGVFAFGDAPYLGSMGGRPLNAPVVALAPTPDGRGYWLTAADGGIFAFGDAPYLGSLGALHLNAPVVAMGATPAGAGYWLAGADGGTFAFGDAPWLGSLA